MMYKPLTRKRRKKPGLREAVEIYIQRNGPVIAEIVANNATDSYDVTSTQAANYCAGNPNLIKVKSVNGRAVWDHILNYTEYERKKMSRDPDFPAKTRRKLTNHLEELIL